MASMPVKITMKPKTDTVVFEMDAERFERMAATFGFFSKEVTESLDQAERDVKAGRVRTVKSLADLRS